MTTLPTRPTARRELVVDNYHGTKVADPYRWLEDDVAPEVKAWSDQQNQAFQSYISKHPVRDELKARMTELMHYERSLLPQYRSGTYYTWRNNGLQNQPVLYASRELNAVGEVVLDPNTLSAEGTEAVMVTSYSPCGSYLAYTISSSGSDWQVIKVMDLRTKENLQDLVKFIRFSGITWLPDSSGFFYTRYPQPQTSEVLETNTLGAMAYLHILGQPQAEDALIHKDPEHLDWGFHIEADEDRNWLFMGVTYSTLFKKQLYFKPMSELDSPWRPIATTFDEGYDVIGATGDTAYLFTQENAPLGKVVSVTLSENGATNWQTVIPETDESIGNVSLINNHLVFTVLHHASHRMKVHDLTGAFVKEIDLPPMVSVQGISGSQKREEFFIQIGGFLYPSTILRYDFTGAPPQTWFQPKINFPFDEYETVQEFATSKDGTKVPMFITRKRGLVKDGSNPTLLYGYGGFNVDMTPVFSVQILAWLERGGVYAHSILRGGSEYGEAWHRAGMLESKQNTFDDFIAAGEYLISEKYTTSKGLGTYGRSNGGLLTGACLVQRPDLYGAVVVGVPVLDMLRYHHFTAGRFWIGEYGCADNPEQFGFLYKYSPLHNVRASAVYPPTLIVTGDTDDRVVPSQARKFIATMQAADGGENPIFIRIEKSAGHGQGKPVSKLIDEGADMYAFLLSVLVR